MEIGWVHQFASSSSRRRRSAAGSKRGKGAGCGGGGGGAPSNPVKWGSPTTSADGSAAAGAQAALEHAIKSLIGVSCRVRVEPPGAVERSVGKARRVIDRRPR